MDFVLFTLLRAAAYLTVALGFALVFGAGRILNLSHGAFFLLGAYLTSAAARGGSPVQVAQAYGLAIAGAMVVAALFFVLLLRHTAQSPNRTMVLCLAFNFVVAESLRAWFGTQGVLVPSLLAGSVEIGGVWVARQQLLIVPAGVTLLALTAFVLYRTAPGRALRAVAQDAEAAATLGIPPVPVLGWTFALAAGMAALAACLITPLTVVGPSGWISPLVKSFAVVILGGVRRLRGTVLAALGLAAGEVATTLWISEGAAEYVSLGLLVAFLIARPKGIAVGG